MAGKNWLHAAGVLWPILVEAAQKRTLTTYGELAPLLSTNPLSMRYALEPIQNYCMEADIPPLSSIVVGVTSGQPGQGFIGWERDDIETAHKQVFSFDWNLVGNPFSGFQKDDTVESLAAQLVGSPTDSDQLYAKVKIRGVAQQIFRRAVGMAYEDGCAVCGLTFTTALDAAHIVSWHSCTPAQRIDPRNGVLLCALHHRMFDSGIITIQDGRVRFYDPEMKDGPYSQADEQMTAQLHGTPARLPANAALRPSEALLEAHHREHGWL
ncbi:HNH endonuclease [Stutzerimonas stutzeri]|uniref:HNH endonuclease n=1 Tax=Stutzerimonas stutzeri TaxID=316 RepID=UPI001ED923D1|nr:HNH endonuclease signature motif containing protein [Stutzerimonas stutzeri]